MDKSSNIKKGYMMLSIKNIDTSTKEGAELFLSRKKEFEKEFGADVGRCNINYKPISIAHPWFYEKVREARNTLMMNIWQMPYNDAVKIERELSHKTWLRLVDRNK